MDPNTPSTGSVYVPGPQQFGHPSTWPTPQPSAADPPRPRSPKREWGGGKTFLVTVAIGLGSILLLVGFVAGVRAVTNLGKSGGNRQHVAAGEQGLDGSFAFVVVSSSCGNASVGNSVLGKRAQGQYCLVTVRVRNIGDRPKTFTSGNQKAHSSGGAEYAADTAAGIYVNDNSETFLNTINPGNEVEGVLVFDIPRGASLASVELHDSAYSRGVTMDLS